MIRNKCDTSDRTSNDHDDTCAKVLKTMCVSAIDVYIETKTHTQTFNIIRTRSQA